MAVLEHVLHDRLDLALAVAQVGQRPRDLAVDDLQRPAADELLNFTRAKSGSMP